MEQWIRENHRFMRLRALKNCFVKNSLTYELLQKPMRLRIFYWCKTLICLLLSYWGDPADIVGYPQKIKYLEVLAFDEAHCYEFMTWENIFVAEGFFVNWKVYYYHNGT
jgi:hypothetical protein